MKVSDEGLNQIKKHEGLRLKAYLDIVGVPTIGYGSTYYENGSKVKMGEVISMERAEQLLRNIVDKVFSVGVEGMVKKPLTQHQFDALVSFSYNLGLGALAGSTLLKKVNKNPNDPTIEQEFLKWNKARVKGELVTVAGLTKRRKEEFQMYNTK